MVYIHSWQEFQEAAEALYERDPNKTRYCVKWRASEGKLVLKITNDVTCLKFKTYSSIFLNRFEALNLALIEKMQNRQKPPAVLAPPPVAMVVDTPAPSAPGTSTPQIQSTGPKAGGVKKKKGKKK
ncbi:signal recognition particle, SRP9/SRP14 subunit [Coprinellus micaceus]|uniref:Signal recognition particle, SRP9/SRP14 subunit n=1 Tax=Coprinellus micaceus TaxID=71717 RepID=A0A4Y7SH16_COPMI|nr:signal recognition particle, SRP9/SRP14 subunit [Coprinellus micaceus]